MAHSVPFGMALLGFFKSPDIDAPAKMPDVALREVSIAICTEKWICAYGNKIPNKSRNVGNPR